MILCAFLDVDHLSHSALTRPAADLSRGERGMMILCAFLDVDLLSHSALTRPAADLSRGERRGILRRWLGPIVRGKW